MQLHTISAPKEKSAKRIGRGGKRGTFSGRGTKGQKARAGRRIRPQLRDILKKIPKKRGYRFTAFRQKPFAVNLGALENNFVSGETVSPATLLEKHIINKRGAKLPLVKILATGEVTKKFIIEGCEISASAKEKIEKAGGSMA
ncbi:MAG: 50S ribosomal protein L15 [Patescibacteria group bacterium]